MRLVSFGNAANLCTQTPDQTETTSQCPRALREIFHGEEENLRGPPNNLFGRI